MNRINSTLKSKAKKKNSYIRTNVYVIAIFIMTLFIGCGYAEITAMPLEVDVVATANAQDGVFITDVVKTGENETKSKINYYISSMLESRVVLEDSTIVEKFEITVFNKNSSDFVFIDALTEIGNLELYDNPNIEMTLEGIEKNVTIIKPSEFLTFTVVFKYKDGADTTNNVLNNKINFRFKEVPKIQINTTIDTLEDIYPDYESQEYLFTVEGLNSENEINNVPVSYSLSADIDKPLSVKIFNELDEEVTKDTVIMMEADGVNSIVHNYKMKIIWDNSNPEDGIEYNTIDYAEKDFNINIKLEAKPDGFEGAEKYLDYKFNTESDLVVKSIPMYLNFDIDVDKRDLTLTNLRAQTEGIVYNYIEKDGVKKYNSVEMEYRFTDDNKYLSIKTADEDSDGENDILKIAGGSAKTTTNNMTVYVSNIVNQPKEMECNVIVETVKPYVTTKEVKINVIDSGVLKPLDDPADVGVEFCSKFGTIEVIWLKERTNEPIDIPNSPDLYTSLAVEKQLTPVTWTHYPDGTVVNEQTVNWIEDETPRLDDWYDYRTNYGKDGRIDNVVSRWANAKNSDGSYFVWIPRYAYRITYYSDDAKTEVEGFYDGYGKWRVSDGKKVLELDPGIETTEINGKTYIVHPAFMKDNEKVDKDGNPLEDFMRGGWDKNLRGFWVAKYEMSRTDSTETSTGSTSNDVFRSIPGVIAVGSEKSGNYLKYSLAYDADKASHMIKMSEWGAVAYLTESQFGRNAHEISPNISKVTGCGSSDPINYDGIVYPYNAQLGAKSSSTGNVYGVYDISGGSWEYTASYNRLAESIRLTHTNYAGEFTKHTKDANGNYISTRYATAYENAEKENRLPSKIYDIGKVGDGTKEVMTENYSATSGAFWNSDNSTFCAATVPVWGRGGGASEAVQYLGIFYSDSTNGSGFAGVATRFILAEN